MRPPHALDVENPPKRILLVEDSPTQAARLSRFLADDGLEIVRATSAEMALRQLETNRPDVILLDNYLPSMSGNEFCREIRLNVNTRAIPVLMLTSEEGDAAQMRGLASGADDYVVKSVDPEILRARIYALLRKSESEPVIPDVEPHFRRARILAIDDDLPYLELVRESLKPEHYHVEIAADPQEGLRRVSEERFDCVLIDFEMPGLNGPEVCRRIRESRPESGPELILIMYSSHDDKKHMTEAFEAGADDYISKSSDFSVARSRIQALLRRKFLVEENRRIADDIRRKELEAMEARAQREMLDRELEIAREVQTRLFPQNLPACTTLEYAAHCLPARAVGGDYYDFLALPGGQVGIAVGDISGKGIPAALLMASLQACVRGQAFLGAATVAELMADVNRLVCEATPESHYAAFFYGRYDPATRHLIYSNAGLNPPMILRGPKTIRLDRGGPPVGLFEGVAYEEEHIQLQPGDLLLLFTDGISDAENPAKREFGEAALEQAARACAGQQPGEMIRTVLSVVHKFTADAPQLDDMTIVMACVR